MPTPPIEPIKPEYVEKIRRLCDPVTLTSPYLPRCVLALIEATLHSFMCSVAAWLIALVEQYNQDVLEPWPNKDEAAASEPRRSRYKMKFPPAASKCSTGAKHVQAPAEVSPEMGFDVGETPAVGKTAAMPIAAILPPRQVWPRWTEALPRSHSVRLRPWGRFWPQPDRCRSASVFSAAGGRLQNCV